MSDFLSLFDEGTQRDFIKGRFEEFAAAERGTGNYDATVVVSKVMLRTKSSGDFVGYGILRDNFQDAISYAEGLANG